MENRPPRTLSNKKGASEEVFSDKRRRTGSETMERVITRWGISLNGLNSAFNKRKRSFRLTYNLRRRNALILLLAIYILGNSNMPRGSVNQNHVTCKDVKRVKALIEHCLKQHINKDEAVELISQVEIDTAFIKLVWQNLEEENQEFFKCYYANLAWKQTMMPPNIALEEQRQIMGLTSTSTTPLPNFDASHNHHAVLSQPSSNFDGSHNHVVVSPLPSSNFDVSHSHNHHAVLSQPNPQKKLKTH